MVRTYINSADKCAADKYVFNLICNLSTTFEEEFCIDAGNNNSGFNNCEMIF